MGAILQFAEKLADGQDWTAAERAQLREVGAQLDGVDVVFGKSEAGDPWCVVTDEGGEVLLHVARIGGDFVVHATHQDEVVQDDNLWAAAKRLLGDVLKERRGVLLAFPPEALGQTAVLVFLFAVAMRGESDHWLPPSHGELAPLAEGDGDAGMAEVAPTPADADREAEGTRHADTDAPNRGGDVKAAARAAAPDAQAPPAADDAPREARGDGATRSDQAPAPAAAPARASDAPPVQAPHDPGAGRGGAAGGGHRTEVASFSAGGGSEAGSGAGAQTTRTGGAAEPSPQTPLSQFVEGGDGDDRIAMSGNVAAAGGRGADTFVLALPTTVHGAPVLLGFVTDFDSAEGDRLELDGKAVMVVDRVENDVLSVVRTRPGALSAAGTAAGTGTAPVADTVPVMSGRHIGYDMDGDGKEDAYVLVTGSGGAWLTGMRAAGVSAGGANVGGPLGGGPAPTPPDLAGAPEATDGFAGMEAHAPIGITPEPGSVGKDFLF